MTRSLLLGKSGYLPAVFCRRQWDCHALVARNESVCCRDSREPLAVLFTLDRRYGKFHVATVDLEACRMKPKAVTRHA